MPYLCARSSRRPFPLLLSCLLTAFLASISQAAQQGTTPAKAHEKKQSAGSALSGIGLSDIFQNVGKLSPEQLKLIVQALDKSNEVLKRVERLTGGKPLPPLDLPNLAEMLKKIQKLDPEQLRLAIQALDKADRVLERMETIGKRFPNRFPRLAALVNSGEDIRLGVSVLRPGPVLADQLGLTIGKGIVLTEVPPSSIAARAGLKENDILLEMGGKNVPADPQDFHNLVRSFPANVPLEVRILRRGKDETIRGLTLPEVRVPQPIIGQPPPRPRRPLIQGTRPFN
jgi:PDZ domain-containing protein